MQKKGEIYLVDKSSLVNANGSRKTNAAILSVASNSLSAFAMRLSRKLKINLNFARFLFMLSLAANCWHNVFFVSQEVILLKKKGCRT